MLRLHYLRKDDKRSLDLRMSAVVVAIIALVILAVITGEDTAAAIVGLFK